MNYSTREGVCSTQRHVCVVIHSISNYKPPIVMHITKRMIVNTPMCSSQHPHVGVCPRGHAACNSSSQRGYLEHRS